MRSINSTTANTTQSASSPFSVMSTNFQSSSLVTQRLDWESLRKQARQLENETDSKLVAFSKLCSNYSTSVITSGKTPSSNTSSDLLFITLSNEIEDLLSKLNAINTKMSECLSAEGGMNSNATVHTLQRHRDILRDYSHEYEKTKRTITSYKEREQLLSLSSNQRETGLSNRRMDGSSNNGSTSLFMKEYDHLKNSHSLIDQQIEMAEMTKENLQSQSKSLRMLQQKMNTIAQKFPMINNLVQKIKLKKRKDSLILARMSNGLGTSNPSKDYDVLFKIVLIGDSAVGKTSLLQRFAEQHFSDTHITTIGVDFKLRTIQVGNVRVKLQVWDTAGQEKFRVITKTYYRNAAGIIVAYDVTNGESFANTKRWIEEVKNNCGDDGVPMVLVGNKCDCTDKVVSLQDQEEYAKLMKLKFFEASAKENINVDEVFIELTRLILERQERVNKDTSRKDNEKLDLRESNKTNKKSKDKCC
ncbi:unnamed protein product [Brachionus calyciflorus]|uniref:Uncharacterized protein n=1 Tax=Brachionus calyciflorus TaxID=104777 RepID=A0A813UD75_9BILA|nr:unnamed protein product [Brachionus calyciflorus]